MLEHKAMWRLLLACATLAMAAACSDAGTTTTGANSQASADGNASDASESDAAGNDATSADASAGDGSAGDASSGDTFDAGLSAPPYTPDRPCNSGGGKLPAGVVEIAWDDGLAQSHVEAQSQWSVVGVPVGDAPLHEGVRFDLEQPTKIWGFRVQYGKVAAKADEAVTVGLYRDFGHNGFDFWQADPIWQVSRCGDEVLADSWIDFRLPTPVVLDQPGLVYVAQLRAGKGSPAFAFDGTLPDGCTDAAKCCELFDACHSAWNFPELKTWTSGGQTNAAWNGLSTSRPLDYLVRLLVEPLAVDDPKQHRFEADDSIAIGHRMAFGDYDNDGWDDLFDSNSHLFRNDNGKLVDVTEATGIAKLGLGANGGVWGDFDNDGDLDLMTFWETPAGGNHLLRNDKGVFVDVTEAAGLSDKQSYNPCVDGNGKGTEHEPAAAASWVDLDGDGKLDLYVANFNCWANYTYYVDRIWHNEGNGTFSEWTGKNGFWGEANAKMPSRGVTAADYDGDGWVDLFVHTYVLVRDVLYHNLGGGKVAEIAEKAGVAGHGVANGGQKRYGHGIGSAWGDLNGDGRLDLVVANLAHPRFWDFSDKSEVLIQQADGTFVDLQQDWSIPVGAAGLTYQETHSVPMLADLDHDGVLDLMMTATYDGRPSELYLGKGDGTFQLARWQSGILDRNGWGLAAADIDHDGDLDVVGKNIVYRNRLMASADAGRWLQVRVVGDVKANRAGIGATVRVVAGGKTFVRVVDGGSGQGCQAATAVHIGLGDATSVDSIEVVWPGGTKTTAKGPIDVDSRVWLTESGKLTKGWAGTP